MSVTRGHEDGAMGETSNSGGIRSVAGNRLENRKPSGPVTNGSSRATLRPLPLGILHRVPALIVG